MLRRVSTAGLLSSAGTTASHAAANDRDARRLEPEWPVLAVTNHGGISAALTRALNRRGDGRDQHKGCSRRYWPGRLASAVVTYASRR
jgi:hypothetical protein